MKIKNDRKQLKIESNSIHSSLDLFQDLSVKESELISGGKRQMPDGNPPECTPGALWCEELSVD